MDDKKIFLLISILLLSACQAGASPTGETALTTATPTRTFAPTYTPSPTHTLTPLPTLSEDEKLATTKDLLTTNAGCKLPCWWGFIPGETRWEDAKRFLDTIAMGGIYYIKTNNYLIAVVNFPIVEEFNPSAGEYPGPGELYNNYFIKDGIIEAIEVDVGLAHTYDLPNLLEDYGQPDEVFIKTYPEPVKSRLPFRIYVFYKRQGIFANYYVEGIEIGDEIQGCFLNRSVGAMMLWPSNREWSVVEIVEKMVDHRFNFTSNPPYLLEEVTDTDEEMFYQKYKGTTEPICMTVPRESFYYSEQEPTPTP